MTLDRHYRRLEAKLAKAQRARKKARDVRSMQRPGTHGNTSCTNFPRRL